MTMVPDDPDKLRGSDRRVLWLAAGAGLVLGLIGVRFLIWPIAAARTFGVADGGSSFELHRIIGLRDLWLAGLALAFAWLREWRALSLWLGFGFLVCLADAAIVATSTGKLLQLGFHLGSGALCAGLGLAAYHRSGMR